MNMENTSNQNNSMFDLSIEGAARDFLQTAATWARIIAIVGFVTAGLSVLEAVIGKAGANSVTLIGSTLGALIGAAITVAINIFLYRFATNTLNSLSNMNQIEFNAGINSLKTYFKILGIILIIVLSFVVLIFLFYGLGRGLR
jgi:glucan phosphoethanolaminetransferase (alkaline phosphatase superfamily)